MLTPYCFKPRVNFPIRITTFDLAGCFCSTISEAKVIVCPPHCIECIAAFPFVVFCCLPQASCFLSTLHRMGYLTGAGSDYAAFVHYLGIASIDMSYTYDKVGKE